MLRLIIVLPPLQGHPLPTALNLGLISKSRKGLISKFIQQPSTAFLLVWLSLGVGVIGEDGDPINLMYFGVLAVRFIGALIARFQPRRMARALFATALAQALVAVIALIAGLGYPWSGPLEILGLHGFFVAPFVRSAWLFRRAAAERPSVTRIIHAGSPTGPDRSSAGCDRLANRAEEASGLHRPRQGPWSVACAGPEALTCTIQGAQLPKSRCARRSGVAFEVSRFAPSLKSVEVWSCALDGRPRYAHTRSARSGPGPADNRESFRAQEQRCLPRVARRGR